MSAISAPNGGDPVPRQRRLYVNRKPGGGIDESLGWTHGRSPVTWPEGTVVFYPQSIQGRPILYRWTEQLGWREVENGGRTSTPTAGE